MNLEGMVGSTSEVSPHGDAFVGILCRARFQGKLPFHQMTSIGGELKPEHGSGNI